MNASAVHPLHSSRATGTRDSLLRRACMRLSRHAGGRARRSVPRRTVSSTPQSRRPLGSEACLVDSYEGGQPPCTIPTKGAHPLRESPGGVPPPRGGAPGTHCSSDCNGCARRTVMNNAGQRAAGARSRSRLSWMSVSISSLDGNLNSPIESCVTPCSFSMASRSLRLSTSIACTPRACSIVRS